MQISKTHKCTNHFLSFKSCIELASLHAMVYKTIIKIHSNWRQMDILIPTATRIKCLNFYEAEVIDFLHLLQNKYVLSRSSSLRVSVYLPKLIFLIINARDYTQSTKVHFHCPLKHISSTHRWLKYIVN